MQVLIDSVAFSTGKLLKICQVMRFCFQYMPLESNVMSNAKAGKKTALHKAILLYMGLAFKKQMRAMRASCPFLYFLNSV